MATNETKPGGVKAFFAKVKEGTVSLSPPPMFSAFAFFGSIVAAAVFPGFAVAAAVLAVAGVLGMMAEDYRLQNRRVVYRNQQEQHRRQQREKH